jgi:hypothetical protein
MAVRRGLDADARDRAAEGNGLQLRHHCGHHALPQASRGERLVGDHALGLDPARLRIDAQDVVKGADVEATPGSAGAIAEEVGGLFL